MLGRDKVLTDGNECERLSCVVLVFSIIIIVKGELTCLELKRML